MERNNKSVLVVEVDTNVRSALSVRLASAGYKVYEAANGLEALGLMETNWTDAVVTDCWMPDMYGLEFLSICHRKWPETPVVIVSGDHDDLALEAVERGAFAWVRKGSEVTLLLEILAHAIQRSVHV
jgi:DNA-binding NtrC family response regulator